MSIRSTAHICHADNCTTRVPPSMFMCKPHWFMLPEVMRDELWGAYVPGQERRMDASAEYLDIAMRCIEYVAQQEVA